MDPVSILAPPFFVAAGLLVVSGVAKARSPQPTENALRAAGLPGRSWVARGLGIVEAGVGGLALLSPRPIVAGGLGALYAAFAVFLVRAIRSDAPLASCGCVGRREVPPGRLHVALNAVAVAVSAGAVFRPVSGLSTVSATTPWFGLPFLAGVLAAGYLAYLAVVHLPDLFFSYRRGAEDVARAEEIAP